MFVRRAATLAGIISIHGSREYGIEAVCDRRLDLKFDDIEVPKPDDIGSLQRQMSRRRAALENGLCEIPPTASDAAEIIAFADSLREIEGILLCHCGGGMSRAPAAALICLAIWKGPGSEEECVEEIFKLRRGAVPHAGLVGFADELLGRAGRLVEALRVFKNYHLGR